MVPLVLYLLRSLLPMFSISPDDIYFKVLFSPVTTSIVSEVNPNGGFLQWAGVEFIPVVEQVGSGVVDLIVVTIATLADKRIVIELGGGVDQPGDVVDYFFTHTKPNSLNLA